MVINFLRRLLLAPYRHPLRMLLVLLVLLPAAGFGGWYLLADYHLQAAQRALDNLDFAGGLKHLNARLRMYPADVETHFLLARTARRGGAFEDAEHHLDICQELGGTNDALVLERTLLRVQQGDLTDLDKSLKRRAEQDSADAQLILEALAQGYLRTYDLRAALDCIRRLLERRPHHVQALLWHAQAMEHLNRQDEAAADYQQALEINPDERWARLCLADILLQRHQPREALSHFQALAGREPEDPAVRLGIACSWRGLGQNAEARPLLAGLLKEHPDEARVLYECGKLAFEDGRLAEAEDLLRRALAKNPYDVRTMYSLQLCLGASGKQAEAKALLEKLQEVDALKKRLFELTKTVVESSHAPVERAEAGWLCLRLGMRDHGLTMFRLALHDDPNSLRALQGLARYYELSGNTDLAKKYRVRAEELDRQSRPEQNKSGS